MELPAKLPITKLKVLNVRAQAGMRAEGIAWSERLDDRFVMENSYVALEGEGGILHEVPWKRVPDFGVKLGAKLADGTPTPKFKLVLRCCFNPDCDNKKAEASPKMTKGQL